MAPQAGNCTDYEPKWFYDTTYGGCSRFWFGGCNAGPNHFESEISCQEECVSPRDSSACFLQKNVGSCQGQYNEWYFDQERNFCSPFVYSGCLGNSNRFISKNDCEDMCLPQDDLELCSKPPKEGACNITYPRWYYDREQGTCQPCEPCICLK
jgi:hypothetical protein